MFAASYQNKNEKVTAIANSIDSHQVVIRTSVHILDATPLCTEGNHQDPRNE